MLTHRALQDACGDAMSRVPLRRWDQMDLGGVEDRSAVYLSCTSHGGFVSGADGFDAGAFGISSAEAAAMDPQQRLLLEHGYVALHGSSHRRASLMGTDNGVFVGMERPDWALAQPPAARNSVYASPRSDAWRHEHPLTPRVRPGEGGLGGNGFRATWKSSAGPSLQHVRPHKARMVSRLNARLFAV